ncbi:hypothetical protein chiPu_0020208 [Chiloscyllium punctatum]|uniref:Uncharacterized protein n=1 Tax=Chiloscyllium punctatum TaxID=137246 RepID=A0A401RUC9_CHIPU|nr:hypothetical protein [Chiloscyllium punctatum]
MVLQSSESSEGTGRYAAAADSICFLIKPSGEIPWTRVDPSNCSDIISEVPVKRKAMRQQDSSTELNQP